MPHDLAHARGRELDPVARGDLAQVLVVGRELDGDGLEPVTGDLEPRPVVEDVRLEHQLVVGVRLDQDDVDARVALPPAAGHLVQPLVAEQLERLVADLGEPHVRHPAGAGAEQRRDLLREVVDVRDQRVDDHDQLRARLDRDVEVRGRDDAAVDQLAVLEPRGLEDHRERGGGADGGGDRHVVPARAPEHDPLAGVEVGGRQVQLAAELAEVVRAVGVGEHGAHVLLDARAGVQARGEQVGERDDQIDRRQRRAASAPRPAARRAGGTAAARPWPRTRGSWGAAACRATRCRTPPRPGR